MWANIPAQLADDSLPLLIGLELVLIGGALAIFAGTGMVQRRRRWSTPVSTYRYNEEAAGAEPSGASPPRSCRRPERAPTNQAISSSTNSPNTAA